MNHEIAINAINEIGKAHNLDESSKLITICEFVSSRNLDTELSEFLDRKFTEK